MSTNVGYCPKCRMANSYSSVNCVECKTRLPWGDAAETAINAQKEALRQKELRVEARQAQERVTSGAPSGASSTAGTSPYAASAEYSQPSPIGDGWYYAKAGKRIGPKSEADVIQLITSGEIRQETMVWNQNMQDWVMARLTALQPLFRTLRNEPPPLLPDEVNNTMVWIIAFAPLVSVYLTVLMAEMLETSPAELWWVALGLNSVLCMIDSFYVRSAGHDDKGLTGLAFFLVPVYLFVRASRLSQSNAYAWVWLLTFFVSLFIPVAV